MLSQKKIPTGMNYLANKVFVFVVLFVSPVLVNAKWVDFGSFMINLDLVNQISHDVIQNVNQNWQSDCKDNEFMGAARIHFDRNMVVVSKRCFKADGEIEPGKYVEVINDHMSELLEKQLKKLRDFVSDDETYLLLLNI